MGLIRESIEEELFFNPKPLTKKEQKTISDFIKADKMKKKRKKVSKKGSYIQQ